MKASGSFQLDAAYTNQKPGSRRKVGRVTARSLASASLYGLHVRKIITALTASLCLTEKEFLSVPLENSNLFKLLFPLVKFDTEKLFPPQHKHESWCCLAGTVASSKTAAKHAWLLQGILLSTLTMILINILGAACRVNASVRCICFSYGPQICLQYVRHYLHTCCHS